MGTWADEGGQLPLSPPTIVIPFAIGGLELVLQIGGLVMGVLGVGERAKQRARA